MKKMIFGDKRVEFAPLANMIEPCKPFIDRLTGLLADDAPVAGYETEKRILEAVRIASRAEFVFLLRVDNEGLIPKAVSKTSSRGISESDYLDEIIVHLPVADVVSKRNNFRSDYKGIFTIDHKDRKKPKINVVIPVRTATPCEFMVVCGLPKKPLFLDRTYAEILSALYSASQSLISVNTLQIEAAILDRLQQSHRYMPDSFYDRRFALFKKRLKNMIVHFQPILCLDRMAPYICSYEALARDPENHRAPRDLFDAAELWGRQFIIELDSYFLKAAVESYSAALANTRREAILDLSVNVYPDSLVRNSYGNVLTEVVNSGLIPPNRLFLEISEKFPLPSSECMEGRGVKSGICSFREILEGYVADLHIGFGIDDFGVGHASLASLLQLHPHYVKIDREILIHESVYDALQFTLALTKALTWKKYLASSKFVIEGYDRNISQRVVLHRLYDLGIRYVQGHFYGNSGPDLYRLDKDMKKYLTSLIKGEKPSARHKDPVYIQK